MKNYEKSFGRTLTFIKCRNPKLHEIIVYYFENYVPDYFWTVPASSTGKYHPAFSLGDGGLVRHTVMGIRVAEELLSLDCYQHIDKESAYTAIMLHDTIKHGMSGSKYTVKNHAELASMLISQTCNELIPEGSCSDEFVLKLLKIVSAIKGHMGQWDRHSYLQSVSVEHNDPELTRFVHLCDYLASRKLFDLTKEELDNGI